MEKALPRGRDPFALYRSWWADIATRKGPDTVRQYRYYALKFLCETGTNPITVTRGQLKEYLGGLRPQYASIIRIALFDFFEFVLRRGGRPDNPLENVPAPTGRRSHIRRAWSLEELTRALTAADSAARTKFGGEQLAWSMMAQYGLGLRPGELCRLTPDKIDLNGASPCVFVVGTKTGVDRAVPIGPVAREALGKLLERSNGRLVGLGSSHYGSKVRRAALLAGIDDKRARAYALRHSFATHLAEKGVHITVIAELLGHSDLRHTKVYTIPSDLEMRKAVGLIAIWPRF